MTRVIHIAAGAAISVAASLAVAQPVVVEGYLDDAEAPDTIAILQPAPVRGTARYKADRTIFLRTRALQNTARWNLAVNDVKQGADAMLKDFSCAVGVQLTVQNTPKLLHVIARAARDVPPAVNRPKDHYRRQRPYLIDEGEICVDKSTALAESPDYPSGHATWGWMWGLIITEATPGRSTQILSRARAYGESRVICGVHNASAVEAARTNASALVAAFNADAEYRTDMDAARAEMAALRAAPGPAPEGCEAEAALTAKTPW